MTCRRKRMGCCRRSVEARASSGSGAIVLGGVRISSGRMPVVTRDVDPGAAVAWVRALLDRRQFRDAEEVGPATRFDELARAFGNEMQEQQFTAMLPAVQRQRFAIVPLAAA